MCRRAGKLQIGMELAKEACRNKTAKAVAVAADISQNSLKEIKYYCQRYGVTLCSLEMTMNEVGESLGKRTGIITVCDPGFAKAVCAKLEAVQYDADETGGN